MTAIDSQQSRVLRFVWWGRKFPRRGKWPTLFGLREASRLMVSGSQAGGIRTMMSIFNVVLLAVPLFCLLFLDMFEGPLRNLKELGIILVVGLAWLLVRIAAQPVPQLPYRSCYFAYRYIFATVPGRFGDTIEVAGYLLIFLAQWALRFLGLILFPLLLWGYEIAAQKVFVEPFPLQLHFVIGLFAAGGARVGLVILCASVRGRARAARKGLATRIENRRRVRNVELRCSLCRWPWSDRLEEPLPAQNPRLRLNFRMLIHFLAELARRESEQAKSMV